MDDLHFSPRVSLEGSRRSFSLSLSSLKIIDSLPRRSSSYSKLPVEPIVLSILKLDGSSFDVQVMRTATVGDLKLAVEAVFSHMPKKGPGKISWPHVWGHFCLFYDGQKLVAETDCISSYGIKDGVQLRFVKHVSSNPIPAKEHSKKSKQQKLSNWETKSYEGNEQKLEAIDICDDLEKGNLWHYNEYETENVAQRRGCGMFPSIWRGWFLYSALPDNEEEANNSGKSLTDHHHHPPRQGCGMFWGLGELMGMCSGKGFCQRDTWRDKIN